MLLRTILAGILALMTGLPSAADDTVRRGYYRVVDVAPGDSLNIRGGPGTGNAVIHTLPNGAITRSTGRSRTVGSTQWLEINTSESLGWASLRFLEPTAPRTFAGTTIPVAGICGGFEPSWYARWKDNTLSVWTGKGNPDQPEMTLPIQDALSAQGFTQPGFLTAGSPTQAIRVVHQPGNTCQAQPVDTDMESGLLIVNRNGTEKLYNGCCRADPSAFQ